MIISHEYKYIYIKTLKTAGTTTHRLLEDYLINHDKDIICRGSRNNNPNINNCYSHSTVNETRQIIGDEIFFKYLIIFNLRNPFERLISQYYWKKEKQKRFNFDNFNDWIRSNDSLKLQNYKILQNILDLKRREDLFVIYFEDLKSNFMQLFELFGKEMPNNIPHLLGGIRGDNRNWNNIISDSDIEYIKNKFKREFDLHERLGYEF